MNLVRCSCGWTAVDRLASALGTQVKLALPTMVEHWEKGHKVTAAVEIYLTVRAASLDLAVANGVDVSRVTVPFEPRRVSRRRPHQDDIMERIREEMLRRMRRDEW